MRKRLYRLISSVLVIFMVLSCPISPQATDDISDAQKKKDEMEAELKDTKSKLDKLESLKSDTQAYIKEMDIYLNEINDNIYLLEQDVVAKQADIEKTKSEIDAAEIDIALQYESMKLRIQYMYENGDNSYMDILFASGDISEILNKAEYLVEILEYDRDMMAKLQNTKELIEASKVRLESDLAALNDSKKEAEEEKAAVEELVREKEAQLSYTNSEIVSKEEAIKRQLEDIAEQEKLIDELKRIEEERKKKATQLTYDGGAMMWPTPGSTRISSPFGNREDPFTGVLSFHSGIDIAAPIGTPIYAAYNGEVAWSNYSSSAGNWIGIDHGNGLYTIYMHMSKLIANVGDKVSTGDLIGLMGSTGRSTGSHLHFSVRLNGEYQSPLSYVTPQ